jgi:conjugal transfer pilus assembly protein TraF
MMSEKRRQPTETVALNAHRAGLEENQQKALTSIFQKGGLFSFSKYLCVLSAKPDTEFHAELLSH